MVALCCYLMSNLPANHGIITMLDNLIVKSGRVRVRQRSTLKSSIAALVFSLPIFTGVLHAASLQEINTRGFINTASEDDFRPFVFVQDGKPTGFEHDMLDELGKYAAFKVHRDIIPWTGMLAALSAGKYDAAVTGTIMTEDRLKAYDFVTPIASATHYYVKRANDDSIKSVADLNGKTVGVQAGSAQLARLPELKAMLAQTGGALGKVVEYPSTPEIYADLANGRLDYMINSIIGAQSVVKERSKIFALGQPVSGPGFHGWMVAKGNTELLNYLSGFIAHLESNGRLAELQIKWFGQSFPDLPHVPVTSVEQFKALTQAK
jgi:polar amino acid transport system substrate-binding protein